MEFKGFITNDELKKLCLDAIKGEISKLVNKIDNLENQLSSIKEELYVLQQI